MDRIEKIKEYLAASPDDSFLQHALAMEYIKSGNDAEAKNLFIKILERDPGYVGSYYQFGKLLERYDNRTEAIRIYEKGMEEALKTGDKRAFSELKSVRDELADE